MSSLQFHVCERFHFNAFLCLVSFTRVPVPVPVVVVVVVVAVVVAVVLATIAAICWSFYVSFRIYFRLSIQLLRLWHTLRFKPNTSTHVEKNRKTSKQSKTNLTLSLSPRNV